MNTLTRYAVMSALVAPVIFLVGCGGPTQPEIDLNAVLDATSETLTRYSDLTGEQSDLDADKTFLELADRLTDNYNGRVPALYTEAVVVAPRADASLLTLADVNGNGQADEGEQALWLIEIDGENARIIATAGNGEVNDRGFSGSGLLAGYLIGSMLSRQRGAGVNPQTLASKQKVSATQARKAARARAGSGSFSKGK